MTLRLYGDYIFFSLFLSLFARPMGWLGDWASPPSDKKGGGVIQVKSIFVPSGGKKPRKRKRKKKVSCYVPGLRWLFSCLQHGPFNPPSLFQFFFRLSLCSLAPFCCALLATNHRVVHLSLADFFPRQVCHFFACCPSIGLASLPVGSVALSHWVRRSN